jgi:hypothetical protein
MILNVIAMVPMLALDLVSTSTTAEVSAILPSEARPVLHRSLPSPIHLGPNQHPFLAWPSPPLTLATYPT